MEELKVRAKNLGEWVEGYFCVYRGIPQILVDESSWEPIDDIKTVGRYTGLCDKNGNKIFEGDIVKGSWNTIFEIYFDDCYLQYRAKEKSGSHHEIDYYGESYRFEVIGNVFDNNLEDFR